ncbi:hypothetical protein GCM10022197_26890 [Microlunatus spumicola]|uniref:Uncharacterized protein n=1 Tax=Microlunatus spumicola TaxID=81499 RepID=A0ABP6XNH3_9ACTN
MRRRRITLIVVALVVLLAMGLAVAVCAPVELLEPSSASAAREAVGLVLVIAGLVTVVVTGVRARRAGALRLVWNSPTATIPRERRRRLLARVRRDLPVVAEEQEDAGALADSLVRQVAMVPVYGGFVVYVLGQSLVASSVFSRWSALLAAVVITAALPLVVRDARRARRWLARHLLTEN